MRPYESIRSTYTIDLAETPLIEVLAVPSPRIALDSVLVVDDDPISLQVISVLLQGRAAEIRQVNSGSEALEQVSHLPDQRTPQCILMDLNMPGLSGEPLALALHKANPKLRIVAMSASWTKEAESLVFDGFLLKPITEQALENAFLSTVPDTSEPRLPATAPSLLNESIFVRFEQTMAARSLREMFDSYFDDGKVRLETIRAATLADDCTTIRQAAHALKGTSAMLGVRAVSEVASRLEEACSGATAARLKSSCGTLLLQTEAARLAEDFAACELEIRHRLKEVWR